MKLNEHNSKCLFREAGIPVPEGIMLTPGMAMEAPFDLPWVLKAQVLSGGRGKAGGIRRVATLSEARQVLDDLFSMQIKGERVQLVRIEPQAAFTREIYLSLTLNRTRKVFSLTVGRDGGVDIESAAMDSVLVQDVVIDEGLQPFQIRNAFYHAQLPKELLRPWSALLTNLFSMALRNRLLLAEINPLVVTGDTLLALDGKVEIDDHHVSINPELNRFFQPEHLSVEENRSRSAGLSFHKLDGFVGLMVNGAGLAMATMDMLNYRGLEAANFLDLGGGADETAMRTAFDILFEDPKVNAIFINIFGGILSCEKVAVAVLAALEHQEPRKPVVIRFAGNSAEQGLKLLQQSGLRGLHLAPDTQAALNELTSLCTNATSSRQYVRRQIASRPARKCPIKSAASSFPLPDDCRILVQGLTGKQGQLHCRLMQEYGSKIVAGVTPGKGGTEVLGVPVYDTVRAATQAGRIDASIIFVPGSMAPDAVLEAADCDIPWVICITDGIPQQNMLQALQRIDTTSTRVIGPNCPGLIMPGKTKIGIMPGDIFSPGPVAVFSRSGTLTYECVDRLTRAGIGQSVCVGIGGDPFIGTTFTDLCTLIRHDPHTKAVVILGEIGGRAEEELGEYMQESGFELPVFGFIAGQTAPPGKRLGHAGAILEKGGSIETKLQAMADSGFQIIASLDDFAPALAAIL